MKPRVLREGMRRWLRRRWAAAALAACALYALAAGTGPARSMFPAAADTQADFPHTRPADLAHLLADINANTHLIPGSWSLEEEAGNYSSWRYAVSYRCGARCGGRLAVVAHAGDMGGTGVALQLRHGHAAAHRVLVTDARCTALPLLPWPQLCEEVEMEWSVSAWQTGARLQERARARCGAGAALLGACPRAAAATAADLRAAAAARAARLRRLLHQTTS